MKKQSDTIGDPATFLEELANQSAQSGYYGLQDANLVFAEVVRERQEDKKTAKSLSALVAAWADLVAQFNETPKPAVTVIMDFLRQPELNIPMADDEFTMLAEQLNNDADAVIQAKGVVAAANVGAPDLRVTDEQVTSVEQLADEAAADGLYGLQDASLLLAEALRELANSGAPVDTAFMEILSGWPGHLGSYRKEPETGTEAIISFLRHPVLNMPLGDDEFAMLQEQLVSEASTHEASSPQATVDDSPTITPPAPTPVATTANPKEPSAPVSKVAQELVDLLIMESEQVRAYLQGIVVGDSESVLSGLQDAGDELERLGNAAKIAGFEGLNLVTAHIIVNVQRFIEQIDVFTSERLDLLLEWIEQVQEYLPSFNDSDAGQLIVTGLIDEQWALPLPFEEMAAILLQIRTETSSVGEQTEAARKETATDEDVTLVLPDDVNQELLDLLLQELPIHTQQFSEAVQRLQSGGNEKDVQLAQRVAHTLKGSANTVGVKGIAVLTHQLEDILIACATEQKLPSRALANALINASDCLESMSEALLGTSAPPADAKAVLQEILDWANRIDKDGLPDVDSEEAAPEVQAHPDTAETAEGIAPEQAQATVVRVSGEQIEALFRVSGESIILNSQAHETSRRMRNQLKLMQTQFDLLQQLGNELEQLIDLRDLTGRSIGAIGTGLDAMEMDQYNELHTASRRMAEAAIDAREISLDANKELDKMDELLDDQQRHVIEVQEVVMQTRLVAISTIAPRLQRSLRQTCRMTGKLGELILMGENIQIDGDTLNAMVDPLMHILRNAVDHGIESEEDRLAQGKPGAGKLTFEFDREGNNILVRCRDDGRGLDYGAIRAAAVKRKLIKAGEDNSEEDLKRFILRPNFSSRAVSTQTSGRGVGMDVVRTQIINMGGTLTIDSVQARGMTIEIRIPLPLSLTYALLTNVGPYRVAVANKGISQIIYSAAGDIIKDEDGKETLLLDGDVYPAVRLMDLLHVPDRRKASRPYAAILMVQDIDKTTAVLIDSVGDSLDMVIKGLGNYIGKIPGYIGATILGDGSVTPVLDVPELLRAPAYALTGILPDAIESAESTSRLPTVLVVDDSLSQRRALEQLLSDAGYRVQTARDGIEAAETLKAFRPNVILTDLEMPRMNGIELAAHIRTQAKIKHLPVIMITSRTTQKHRQMADDAGVDAYFTKPVRDEELLIKMQNLIDVAAERGKQIA
jgi:chemotaxis protein histidine kinase CheA/ActR/RegA family two-component response regulator